MNAKGRKRNSEVRYRVDPLIRWRRSYPTSSICGSRLVLADTLNYSALIAILLGLAFSTFGRISRRVPLAAWAWIFS
jgi:hypothetical protein